MTAPTRDRLVLAAVDVQAAAVDSVTRALILFLRELFWQLMAALHEIDEEEAAAELEWEALADEAALLPGSEGAGGAVEVTLPAEMRYRPGTVGAAYHRAMRLREAEAGLAAASAARGTTAASALWDCHLRLRGRPGAPRAPGRGGARAGGQARTHGVPVALRCPTPEPGPPRLRRPDAPRRQRAPPAATTHR